MAHVLEKPRSSGLQPEVHLPSEGEDGAFLKCALELGRFIQEPCGHVC